MRARSYVVVEAPPATEKNEAFLRVGALLADAGVKVPAVLGADLERGFLLLEDLGDRLLLPALDPASVDGYYRRAFEVLAKMAAMDTGGSGPGRIRPAAVERRAGPLPGVVCAGTAGIHTRLRASRHCCARFLRS